MVTPPSLFCDTCGAANQPRASYCHACGRPLQGNQPTVYNSATGRLLANVMLKQRYHIIAPTGKGGMGAVYKAEDTQLGNRLVAIKEMSQSGLSPQEVKDAANAFKQEALLLAGLQHPNLPSIFDHFEENGRWYLVMSFIQGETLADYLSQAKAGKLPLNEALQIGLQLCDVLDYLHAQQPPIVFRDLKPSNIMRTASGHIYLIDFGIARHFKPGKAKDTVYYGSMGYAPPEQYGRAQTTPRSDIYSLGALLYHLVSGHDPASSPFQFPLLQSLVPTASSDLATLLAQMLELDEDKRPANIALVKQKLQAIASPVAPSVPPPIAPTVVAPTQLAAAPTPTPKPSSTGQLSPSASSLMLNSPSGVPTSSASKGSKPPNYSIVAIVIACLMIASIVLAVVLVNNTSAGRSTQSGHSENTTLSSPLGNPLVHVGPNPSACTGPFAGTGSGVVNVHLDNSGNNLNVSVHDALPNTTYVVDIRCVGAIGTFSTNSEGIGTASLDLPSTLPTTFYIDVEVPPPGGAGAGGYGDLFIAGPFSH